MTLDDTALLDTLDRLARETSPAPWTLDERFPRRVYCDDQLGSQIANCEYDHFTILPQSQQDANAAYIAACSPDAIARLVALARQGAEMQTALRRVGIGRSDECGDSGEMVEWFATTEQGEQGCGTLDDALQRLTDAAMEDGRREVSERFRTTLSEHWLTEIQCHHESRTDTAHCFCTVWASGALPSVGAAVDAWVTHVMDAARAVLPLPDGGPTNG